MTEPHHPLVELTLARLRELFREPAIIFWVFGFPVLLAVGLGVAFRSKPPDRAQIGVVAAPAALGADFEQRLKASEELEIHRFQEGLAKDELRRGRVDVVVALTSSVGVDIRFDPQRPESRLARALVENVLRGSVADSSGPQVHDTIVSERGQRYIDFLLPGLMGLNLMSSSMWGIGYAIVDNRSRRLMKRLAATPMRRSHYLLSFLLSRLLLLGVEMVFLVLFGLLAFDVEVQGRWADLVAVGVAGAMSFAGLGLLVAARPSKTEVASGWMNFVMMPMWLLSGSFFSYERFPEVFHGAIRLLPLTALNDALRGVINESMSLTALGPELAVLLGWGVVGFFLSLRLFRWQ